MTQEIKDKWLTALRSGDYEKETGYLRMNDRYCALGVLVDITGRGTWCPYGTANGSYYFAFLSDKAAADVKGLLTSWERSSVRLLNDSGKPFSAIADWIEQNV